jgi:hypothetical protein
MDGVQSFGEKRAVRRKISSLSRSGVRRSNEKSLLSLGLIAREFIRRIRGWDNLAERGRFECVVRVCDHSPLRQRQQPSQPDDRASATAKKVWPRAFRLHHGLYVEMEYLKYIMYNQIFGANSGGESGIRTLDPDLGKVVVLHNCGCGYPAFCNPIPAVKPELGALLPFFFPPVGPVIVPRRRNIRQCAHGPQPDRPYRWMIALT